MEITIKHHQEQVTDEPRDEQLGNSANFSSQMIEKKMEREKEMTKNKRKQWRATDILKRVTREN